METITTALEEGVLTITLNRPERLNAFTATMMNELIGAFDSADSNDAVRAVIVTGAGRAFCAGADLGAGGKTFDFEARAVACRCRRLATARSPGATPQSATAVAASHCASSNA